MKHVVLYVGHLYKLFWTKKIWLGWQGGVKERQNMAQNGPRFYISLASEPSKGPYMCQGPLKSPQNDSSNCPWLTWVHFRGPWPIQGPLEGSEAKIILKRGPCWAIFWPSQKGPFPLTNLAGNLCVDSQIPPGPKSKSWQMGNFWPKKIVQARGVRRHSMFYKDKKTKIVPLVQKFMQPCTTNQ